MNLIEQIEQTFLTAFKAKDQIAVDSLRMLKSNLKNKSIELKKELTDEDALAVVRSEVKKRRDSIEAYEQGGRSELAKREQDEIDILQKFLPVQISEEKIKEKVEQVLETLPEENRTNFGLVMKTVMAELKGEADGGSVSKAVKDIISHE